jgi:predicted AAA+ superfamily ATPase
MRYIHRKLEKRVKSASQTFPVIILTGPRRSGKTTMLQKCFPAASYYLLEDPDVIDRARNDPRSFLDNMRLPAILDEIQNVPELFNYIRTRADRSGKRKCQWILTGSQEPALMKGVSESMAGRAAIFHLLPLSKPESEKVTILRGGFPEVVAMPKIADTWFRSYLQTYLERDIRSVSFIRDLTTFRKFLALVASRIGQVLNRTDIAAPLGVSIPTISEWLGMLEATHQIILVAPFFENFGKRLIKSPKIYFTDTGLAAYLLGIESERSLVSSPFRGALFESFVASEISKAQLNAGKRRDIYYFRDRQGLEVDFLVPLGNKRLALIEAKASRTIKSADTASIARLEKATLKKYATESFIVHMPAQELQGLSAIQKGVKAGSYDDIAFMIGLGGPGKI